MFSLMNSKPIKRKAHVSPPPCCTIAAKPWKMRVFCVGELQDLHFAKEIDSDTQTYRLKVMS